MHKIIATALITATSAAALSGCNLDSSSTAGGGKAGHHHAGSKAHKSSKPAHSYTTAQEQAIQAADNYLAMGKGFSRAGLIQQLSSKAGNGFKVADAAFAADHVKVDWNKQAVESAKNYMSMGMGFSRASLIQQLTAKAGDQFTMAQATYAANHVGL